MLDLSQLLQVPHVDPAFDISPDGSRIAFSWNKTGDWQLYELNLASGESHAITKNTGAKFSPHYSPDGTQLAYVVDFDGGENFHLYLKTLSSEKERDLTPDISYALQPNTAWSPDGREIAFLADKSGHFDAYILNVKDGNSRLIFSNGHPCWNVTWSPDGRWLAGISVNDQSVYLWDLQNRDAAPRVLRALGVRTGVRVVTLSYSFWDWHGRLEREDAALAHVPTQDAWR